MKIGFGAPGMGQGLSAAEQQNLRMMDNLREQERARQRFEDWRNPSGVSRASKGSGEYFAMPGIDRGGLGTEFPANNLGMNTWNSLVGGYGISDMVRAYGRPAVGVPSSASRSTRSTVQFGDPSQRFLPRGRATPASAPTRQRRTMDQVRNAQQARRPAAAPAPAPAAAPRPVAPTPQFSGNPFVGATPQFVGGNVPGYGGHSGIGFIGSGINNLGQQFVNRGVNTRMRGSFLDRMGSGSTRL